MKSVQLYDYAIISCGSLLRMSQCDVVSFMFALCNWSARNAYNNLTSKANYQVYYHDLITSVYH